MDSATWIIIIACLGGVACASVGVFLVLRRMSMLGDAISHSVLLGIVLAFLLTSSRAPLFILLGAGSVGLLTAYLTSVLNKHGKLQEDASIGVVFTWLFALGVILISVYADKVDLDQECVLYGEIAFAPLDTIELFGVEAGPRAVWMLAIVSIANLIFIGIGYRNLKVVSFDPVLASSLGINVTLWHYLLMSFVSLTTVASFEAVGAILVVAMLVVPANTAYLFAKSLPQMLTGSIIIALVSSYFGYLLADWAEASVSASIVVVSGGIFFVALVFYHLRNASAKRVVAPLEV